MTPAGGSIKQTYANYGLHLQQTDWTCGPATLLNVLAAKGEPAPEEGYVAELCAAIPDTGTDNAQMVAAAEHLGLDVLETAEQGTLARLERWAEAGAHVVVCYISLSGAGHYALLREHDAEALYFVDCSYGLLRIKRTVFVDRWRNRHEPVERWYMAIM